MWIGRFAGNGAKDHSIAHGFLDLLAVASILWRECHHCFVASIGNPNDVAVQCSQNTNARMHQGPIDFR